MTTEPVFVPRPGQIDYTQIRYAPVLTAVVVCRGKVLLLQRSCGMRSCPNYWSGISGFLDDDRSVEEKARQARDGYRVLVDRFSLLPQVQQSVQHRLQVRRTHPRDASRRQPLTAP